MADTNFMRRYIMTCGKAGKKGFRIGNIESAEQTALHVSFSIEKSSSETPNDAKVQIWNLSNASLKILEQKDCTVEMKAGYGDSTPLILLGTISSVITTADNADRMTELTVVDGRVALRDSRISVSINGKVNAKTVYKKIAKAMGIPIIFAKDLSFKKFPNGFSYVGKAKNALQKVAKYCGHKWSIQNEILQVTLPGRSISTRGYLLSKETGLVGIPKRIKITVNNKEQSGWEVRYFLNGSIGVNDIVKMESDTASGYFLVHKVTMDGDNYEGDWMCTAQLLAIKLQTKLDKKTKTSKKKSGGASSIKKGDNVKLTRTISKNGKTYGYQYSGGTFMSLYSTYDVIRVNGNQVVIGKGNRISTTVNKKDLKKV